MNQNLYVPERNDIIWLDHEPKKGKEIGKYRPSFVLSTVEYAKKTSLIICCPISTSIRGHITEVEINNLEQPCVIATSIIQTLDWQQRKAKFVAKAERGILQEVLERILPLIGAESIL